MKLLLLLAMVVAVSLALPIDNEIVPNTPENLVKLASGDYPQNTWELSGQFEGDMVLSKEQMLSVLGIDTKTGLIAVTYRWKNNVVPYIINESYFTRAQIDYIHQTVKEFARVSCITVRPRVASDVDYVEILGSSSGCSSSVGRRGGRQTLNLAPNTPGAGCFRSATILHEFLHAMGFYHMQSATERDNFVTIMWNNIQSGTENNFQKYDSNVITNFNVKYDYGSVMHYGGYGFSSNGQPTIVPKDPNVEIGQRIKMSDSDILRIKKMYCGA